VSVSFGILNLLSPLSEGSSVIIRDGGARHQSPHRKSRDFFSVHKSEVTGISLLTGAYSKQNQ